jgi:hypothetical protein
MLSSSAHRAEPPRNLATFIAIPTMFGERARGVHALVDLLIAADTDSSWPIPHLIPRAATEFH